MTSDNPTPAPPNPGPIPYKVAAFIGSALASIYGLFATAISCRSDTAFGKFLWTLDGVFLWPAWLIDRLLARQQVSQGFGYTLLLITASHIVIGAASGCLIAYLYRRRSASS